MYDYHASSVCFASYIAVRKHSHKDPVFRSSPLASETRIQKQKREIRANDIHKPSDGTMSRSSSVSPSPNPMRRKSCARRCERACCSIATYFPLAFVYGLTTWAVCVESVIGFHHDSSKFTSRSILLYVSSSPADELWLDPYTSTVGVAIYVLLNWSYTTAVFTSPGSPLEQSGAAGYSSLPTHEPPYRDVSSFTVKSTGELRFCKKCQSRKPDRAHHCSTCKRCVLKMDHHCPWLATCVGLRNYKAFLLFLVYTTLFCWICFAITSSWLWNEALSDSRYVDSLLPINYIMLCVISGIIGLVLTGFTLWHISLTLRGTTTIECLEKTRYLSPLRKTMQRQKFGHENGGRSQTYGQQLAEIHANALPGVSRPEEGEVILENGEVEERGKSRARDSLRRDYAEMERSREHDRYEDYLDEQDSDKLPSAFDLGWKRNLWHLLGEKRLLWFLPICNTTGDGWHWEANPGWIEARDSIREEREARWRKDEAFAGDEGSLAQRGRWPSKSLAERHYLGAADGGNYFDRDPDGSPSSRMSMKTLRRRSSFDDVGDEDDDYEFSSDGEQTQLHSNRPSSVEDTRKQD